MSASERFYILQFLFMYSDSISLVFYSLLGKFKITEKCAFVTESNKHTQILAQNRNFSQQQFVAIPFYKSDYKQLTSNYRTIVSKLAENVLKIGSLLYHKK